GYSGLAWTDIPGPGRIDCTAKGQVSVFGALFLAGSSGLVMVNMARSGRRLADVALQDGSWRTRWFAALQPDVFILNAGTNDWRNASSEAHKADLRRVMNDAVAGAPDMRLMLVQHNAAGGVGQPNEQYFNDAAAKRELADELGIPLITVESVLGSYAVARSRGLLMDTVHPSDTGNRILGRFFARKVIEQISAHRPAPQP
ncbi:MAG: SGNH/GDSL hydrolase family protein, partial [Novosphingobium sp.]|nr:SGNH/GDSL hydrolase family protein [Novosphingobium sp.]